MAKHKVSSDNRMNETLKEEVQGLRGGILAQAEKNDLPERFVVTPHPDTPSMIIKDTLTERETKVPLFAYGEVRKALKDLFA